MCKNVIWYIGVTSLLILLLAILVIKQSNGTSTIPVPVESYRRSGARRIYRRR